MEECVLFVSLIVWPYLAQDSATGGTAVSLFTQTVYNLGGDRLQEVK